MQDQVRARAMASDLQQCPSCPLQLTDVYEIAEKVGEHFQQLIGQFGPTHLTTLIPAVVGALEHLETAIQENHSLQIRNRKLMLMNDSLTKEREERIKLSNELEELQYRLEIERQDKKRLALRIENLVTRNEDLAKQLARLQGTALTPVPIGEDPLNHHSNSVSPEDSSDEKPSSRRYSASVVDVNSPDILQLPRMSKRLSQVELDLQKTRRKLIETHHSLQETSAENRSLKVQLDDSRAEAALRGLENSRHESDVILTKTEPPKFYKQDLLAVLRERNELKEELDGLRDDLYVTKAELKQFQVQAYSHRSLSKSNASQGRQRATTRVREILDSITESVQVDPVSRT